MPSDQTLAQDTWDLLSCEVDEYGSRYWVDSDDNIHREDGPAIIWADGTQFWYKHGFRHREDGPAIIYPDGEVEYWIDHRYLPKVEFNARKLTVNG